MGMPLFVALFIVLAIINLKKVIPELGIAGIHAKNTPWDIRRAMYFSITQMVKKGFRETGFFDWTRKGRKIAAENASRCSCSGT